jgi:D-alanyl-D-alanine endopeptidase (penicillin-binding protein 7)
MWKFLLALIFGCGTLPAYSQSLVIYDLVGKTYIEGKNADMIISIASITKLVTAMILIDAEQDLDQKLKVRGRETSNRIQPGLTLTRRELLELMLVTSDNLAAEALLNYYPGGNKAGLAAMNRLAENTGAKNTVFVDASGINSGNKSTADDLIKILYRSSGYDLIKQFSNQEGLEIDIVKSAKKRTWIEKIIGRATNPYARDPQTFTTVVAKTGYTRAAGFCLAMIIEINQHRYALISTGNQSRATRKDSLDRALSRLSLGQLESQFRDDGHNGLF